MSKLEGMRGINFGREDKVRSEGFVCSKREGKKSIGLEIGANLERLELYKGWWGRGVVFWTQKLNNRAREGEVELVVVLRGIVENCYVEAGKKSDKIFFRNFVWTRLFQLESSILLQIILIIVKLLSKT